MDNENTPNNQQPVAVEQQPAAPVVPPVEDLVDIEHFAKLKLRVAQIEAAEAVPKSKKLVKLQLDLGPELGKRQILAGILQHYAPETLIGRRIVVIANLKPAMLMGLESRGMLMAASSADGSMLKLLDPGQDMPLGSEVR